MSKIETHSLSAGYGKKIIIENAEIEIKSGEIVSLIGANGSGKSTILKTIAGQLEAVSGTVFIDGRDISKMGESEIAVKLSIMTTEKVRAELMTCKDVVESGRYPYTGRLGILSQRDRDIVQETFRLVDGVELVNQDFNRISARKSDMSRTRYIGTRRTYVLSRHETQTRTSENTPQTRQGEKYSRYNVNART